MTLDPNVGTLDRFVRAATAVVLAYLAFAGLVSGGVAVVAWIAAALLAVTAVVRFCPIYAVLDFSTIPVRQPPVA
jgi:hypothetical protein